VLFLLSNGKKRKEGKEKGGGGKESADGYVLFSLRGKRKKEKVRPPLLGTWKKGEKKEGRSASRLYSGGGGKGGGKEEERCSLIFQVREKEEGKKKKKGGWKTPRWPCLVPGFCEEEKKKKGEEWPILPWAGKTRKEERGEREGGSATTAPLICVRDLWRKEEGKGGSDYCVSSST